MILSNEVTETYKFLKRRIKQTPEVLIILGSGLHEKGRGFKKEVSIPYGEIPNLFSSTVEGHENILYTGEIADIRVIILSGRAHYYEGFEPEVITFPIRVISKLGVKRLIITCTSGGIRKDLITGDILFVKDHLNLMGINPLRGHRDSVFIDMSCAYHTTLYPAIKREADNLNIPLKKGVLAAMTGPSYETPAEIRMLQTIGADAVCMSTIPEVIMARYLGMKVIALSLITNNASEAGGELKHEDVLHTAATHGKRLSSLVERITPLLVSR